MNTTEKIKSLEDEIKVLRAKLERSELLYSSRSMWMQSVFDSMPNAFFIKNSRHQFVIVNKAFQQLIDQDETVLIGNTDNNFVEEDIAQGFWDIDAEVLATGNVKWKEDLFTSRGEVLHLLTSKSRIEDRNGNYFILGLITDITNNQNQRIILEKKNAEIEEQKKSIETLLKEVHHRVKNNLQVVCSLLNLQMNEINDPMLHGAFQNSKNRIVSMSKVHEALYLSNNFASLNFRHYVNSLMTHLESVYRGDRSHLIKVDVDDIFLDTEFAVPLGLIINEIVNNSFKHAVVPGQDLEIYVRIKKVKDFVLLEIGDNGPGIKNAENSSDKTSTLGLELIQIFSDQMDVDLTVKNENGTHYSFQFSLKDA